MDDDFDQLGFLGNQVNKLMEPHLKERASLYETINQLNELALTLKDKIEVKSGDIKAVLAAILFIKVINCFQAIVLLSKKGLGVECGILTRALLEVTFPLRANAVNHGFAEKFILTEKSKRLKLMNIILNDKQSFSSIHSLITEEQKETLTAEIQCEGIKDLDAFEIARQAGMTTFYQLAYRHLSEEVHTIASSLQSYVITDEHGDVVMFENGPQHFEFEKFKTAVLCLLIAMDSMNDIFSLEIDSEIKRFEDTVITMLE